MNQQSIDELRQTSSANLEEAYGKQSVIKALEADAVIRARIEEMRGEGKVLTLSEDEERMLRAYRSFRLRSKYGDIFKWRCHGKSDAVAGESIEVSRETGLIVDPREV